MSLVIYPFCVHNGRTIIMKGEVSWLESTY
jgi:hypothetical protein